MATKNKLVYKLNKLDSLTDDMRAAVAKEVQNAALALEATEKQIIIQKDIVDTGFLLNSVQAQKKSEMEWVVGNGAEYSPHQNYGTTRQPARPFVEPAIEVVFPQFLANVAKAIDNI